MAQPADREARVTARATRHRDLAEEVHVSRQDAAATRLPAGAADRDVAEIGGESPDFRQATAGLNAVREDQLDLRRRMTVGFARVKQNSPRCAAGSMPLPRATSRS
jgi:hypothetical protein